jgi:hypothetical protein
MPHQKIPVIHYWSCLKLVVDWSAKTREREGMITAGWYPTLLDPRKFIVSASSNAFATSPTRMIT